MKIFIIVLTEFLFISFLYPQTMDTEKLKNHLVELRSELMIDYTKEYDQDEILAYHQNVNCYRHYISSEFAITLFKQQTNQFQYIDNTFYYNNSPVNLFEEYETIKSKFPEKSLLLDVDNYLGFADGVKLYFIDYEKKKYLVNIIIDLKLLYKPENNDFGILLFNGFPLNGSPYDSNSFSTLYGKLNKHLTKEFSYISMHTFSTSFEKIEIKEPKILKNYFADKEKFMKTKNIIIENMIIMNASYGIKLRNQLTYVGID